MEGEQLPFLKTKEKLEYLLGQAKSLSKNLSHLQDKLIN